MNIPFAKPCIHKAEVNYVTEAIESGWISDGKFLNKFEERLKNILGAYYVLATSNGTSALNLAMLAVKHFTKKRSILVPGFCFQAAANLALQLGFTPVFYDVSLETMQVSLGCLESVLKNTNDIAAIIVVHNYGFVSEYLGYLDTFTRQHDIFLIEDCAEAIFSRYPDLNISVGSRADMGTFSLHATKTLSTGEGGLVTTGDSALNNYLLLCRSHGLQKRGTYNHMIPGNNFRMSNITAAFGNGQLDYYPYIIGKKNFIRDTYFSYLSSIKNLLPPNQSNAIMWSMPVRIVPEVFKYPRDAIIYLMAEQGVETRPGFVSPNDISYFEPSHIPNSDTLANTVLVLPAFLEMTESNIKNVCDILLSFRR